MGKLPETYSRVLAGVSDIGHIAPDLVPGLFPAFSIFSYPLHLPSAEVLSEAIVEMVQKDYMVEEFADVKLLAAYSIGPYVFWVGKDRFTKIEQIEGKKIRASSDGWYDVIKAIGAVPVTGLPSGEVYISLQKGIIDANFMPWNAVNSFKLHEVCKYAIAMDLMTLTHIEVMNKATFEALPQSGKDYINNNWANYTKTLAIANDAVGPSARDKFLAVEGREIVELYPGEWDVLYKRISGVWDNWIARVEARGIPGTQATKDLYDIMIDLGIEDPLCGYTPD